MIDREHDAELVLLHVADKKGLPFSSDRTMASAEPLEKLHHLAAHGIAIKHEPTCVIGFGTPDTAIIEEAKRHKADLIVIGARGSSRFASAMSHFGGGTAYKVAATADCLVLTIRKN